jgi:hypothetical protein
MNLEKIKQEWRSEMERSISPSEIQALLDSVQKQYANLERSIHGRDVREIVAALLVVALFVAGWPLCRSSPAAISGIGLVCAGAVCITLVLLSARRPEPLPFGSSVLEFSRGRLAWLDRQIRLLQTVAWWYVAPICVGCLLFTWGITDGRWFAFGLQAVLTFAVGAGIIALNRWAVRKGLQPVRDDLARLIEALEPADPSHQVRQKTDSRGGE